MKRQTVDWEKCSPKTYLLKDFYTDFIKNIQNNKKRNNAVKHKWAKYLNRHFTKDNIEMAIQDAEYKCWLSFVARETHFEPKWYIITHWLKWLGR